MSDFGIELLCGLGMTPAEAARMARKMVLRSPSSREALVKRGDMYQHLIYIVSGELVDAIQLADGRYYPMAIHTAGNWVGFEFIMAAQRAQFDLVPDANTEIYLLPASALADANIEMVDCLAQYSALRATRLQEIALVIKCASPLLRVLYMLGFIAESQRYQHAPAPSVVSEGEQLEFNLSTSQLVLARLCGMSRTKLSEILQSLKSIGIVRIEYGSITLLQFSTWRTVLQRMRKQHRFELDLSVEQVAQLFGRPPPKPDIYSDTVPLPMLRKDDF